MSRPTPSTSSSTSLPQDGAAAATTYVAGTYSVVASVVTLAGWIFGIRRLADWSGDGIAMFPNTAICTLLGGLALLLLDRRMPRWRAVAVRCAAAAMGLIGGLTLCEHLANINLGIDTLLFESTWGQRAATAPMRMGPPACTSFVILAIALLLVTLDARARRAASALAILSIAIASLSLTGYWFGADQLFGIARYTGIAWQTSTIVAALGIGLVAAVPEHGLTAALLRHDAGGTVLRRLVAVIILFPLLLGWLRTLGQEANLYDTAFGTAMRTLVEIMVLLGMLWWTANSISQHARAAQVAEMQLAAIIESSDDAIISRSFEGVIRSWNPGAERLFGYSAAEAVGKPISLIVPSDLLQEEEEVISRLKAGERVEHFESVRLRRGGEKLEVSLTISLVKNDAGQVFGASKIVRDITRQKRARRRLETQDAVTRALAESSTLDAAAAMILPVICEYFQWSMGAIWYVDLPASVLRCSATWSRSKHESQQFDADTRQRTFQPGVGLPGRIWASGTAAWIPDVAKDDNFPRASLAQQAGLHAALGFPISLNENVLGVVEFFSSEVRQPDEDLMQLMTAVGAQLGQFIERQRAETALRESERLFKVLTSYAPAGIFQTDADGNCLFVNARWCEMAGMSPEQAYGKGWIQALYGEDRERVAREWNAAAAAGRSFASEYRFQTPEGRVTWLSGSAVPLRNDDGNIVGFIGTVTDITEQKLAEQSLVTVDRRKDEFLATLAHELRSPLAPIRNALEIIQRAQGDHELLESTRQMMQRQLSHLVRLVDDLLDVSRITRDKLELRKAQVELAPIIMQATEACRPALDHMQHELTVLLPQEPIYLDADAVRLAQVFGNLINNACKYTPQHGQVTVTAEPAGSQVRICVRDNGLGIPADMLPKVFDMFTQVGPTSQQAQGGLGIGLTLVKRLVEMHGGSIQAASDGIGCGSQFIVHLPVLATAVAPAAPPLDSRFDSSVRRRILIVDDNRDAAQSLAVLLKMNGNETQTAPDGRQAIDAAEQFRPDVVLLDIGLPDMTGYDACRAIREKRGKELTIIALTGWGQDEDRRKSKEAGFDCHLVKPVDPADLIKLLAAAPATVGSPLPHAPATAPARCTNSGAAGDDRRIM